MSEPTPLEPTRSQKVLGVAVAALLVLGAGFGLGRCTAGAPEPEHAHAEPADEAQTWTCSMHPQIRQRGPGSCPICGMDLIPVTSDDDDAPNRVSLSERARALAGIRTSPVRRLAGGSGSVRLLGRVDYDETTLTTITTWIGGRIDRLHLNVTGAQARRGQTVATLYSPEVYAAQQDLITAKRQVDRLASSSELARSAANASLEAARQRLRLLGIPDAEITRMESQPRPDRQVAIRSPFAGTVIERLATEGSYVQTGTPLYRIADLSRLWVQLDAYESDLGQLTVGQTVEMRVEALPGETFEGRVAFIDPVIDARRRTARVRIELSNPGQRLRPGMFVEANLSAGDASGDAAQPLVVPATAPLFTGRRSVVYVQVPDATRPTYEARVVRLGPRVGDVFPVVAGLNERDVVVTEGAFALDADLQIRGGDSMMTGGDDRSAGPYDGAIDAPEAWDQGLRPIVDAYLQMQARLADDDADGARAAAGRLLEAVDAFEPTEPAEAMTAWEPIERHLAMHARLARDATSIEAVRAQFEPLSVQIATLLQTFGNPTATALRVAYCPMAFDNRGAQWVQTQEEVDNAYFGSAMRTCGDIRAVVEPGGHLPAEAPATDAARAPMTGGHTH
ncbi:MAG: efflux RND transporter periplasmic adaptor subunit [Sandaracinaceae bacterium]|nr:efflux RND transporter periplasmic adaptor subunit [Sandaracinaceae bacterium]